MAAPAPGVADDVRQCLLHDPERCQIDARRERPPLAVHLERDLDAGRGRARDEVVEAVQARRRRRGAPARRLPRSTPSTERTSRRASALASLIAVSAVRACSGCSSIRCRATPDWTLISEMLCASTSCSSRAMRSRSSSARRRAWSSRGRRAWRSAPGVRAPPRDHQRTSSQAAIATTASTLRARPSPERPRQPEEQQPADSDREPGEHALPREHRRRERDHQRQEHSGRAGSRARRTPP